MEASAQPRSIEGEKAQRIVGAMRESVGRRGVAASTFDNVAREAGVSRGLLHYYFGTKERLLGEVVRRDCDVRMEILDRQLAGASTADDFVAMLATSLRQMLDEDPDFLTLIFELFTLSRHNEEIAAEFTELLRRTREHVAGVLEAKEAEGVLHLRADAVAIADVLFSLGDGLGMRLIGDPEHDFGPTIDAAVLAVRALFDDR